MSDYLKDPFQENLLRRDARTNAISLKSFCRFLLELNEGESFNEMLLTIKRFDAMEQEALKSKLYSESSKNEERK